jgi:hypothetical protein
VSDRRFFDHDEFSGLTEWFIGTDEGFIIETTQDVEPLIEANKRLWNNTEKHTKYGEWTRIASTPFVILMELNKKGILRMDGSILDDKKYRDWLNDHENRHFRTRAGRV